MKVRQVEILCPRKGLRLTIWVPGGQGWAFNLAAQVSPSVKWADGTGGRAQWVESQAGQVLNLGHTPASEMGSTSSLLGSTKDQGCSLALPILPSP